MLRTFSTITLIVGGTLTGASAQSIHDDFYHLGEINKASIVMLAEGGLVPSGLAETIASGIRKVISEHRSLDTPRSSDYLVFELSLIHI